MTFEQSAYGYAFRSKGYRSLMVRFAPKDSERPVYLLQEQQSGHRVGKRHL